MIHSEQAGRRALERQMASRDVTRLDLRRARRWPRRRHAPLIATARLNDVDPKAWLADLPAARLHELLP